jgi:hypothetical protein
MADVLRYCSDRESIASTHTPALLICPDREQKLQADTFIGVNFLAGQFGKLDLLYI